MDDPLDFFIHISKTAGTTMQSIMDRQYHVRRIMRVHRVPADELPGRLKHMSPQIALVAGGHLHFAYSSYFPRPFRAFTILREPVKRAISLYDYVAREKRHRMHEAFLAGKISMEFIARAQGSGQARLIAGYGTEDAVDDDVLLARAKDTLEHKITVFGLTECFDETLLLFTRVLGWTTCGYARKNVTRRRPNQQPADPAKIALIREHSAVDIALYEFARDLFEKRIAAEPPEFVDQLAALRRSNEAARRFQVARAGWGLICRSLGLAN